MGGDPGRWSVSVEEFHRANATRAERFPRALLATTTHDTKRSGDMRARLVALTWMADEWLEWRRRHRTFDDPVEDELLWQTLVGTWPIGRERVEEYLLKAMREVSRNTGWLEPNEAHERAALSRVRRLYPSGLSDDVAPFAGRVAEAGRRVSLGMTLLKLTAPGVPDLYQGDELETLGLVDPDNRRPVDWERRRRLLRSLRCGEPTASEAEKPTLVRRVLALRAARPDVFAGGYEPIEAGPAVCGFRRDDDVEVVVPLDPDGVKDGPGGWRDLLPELPVGLYVKS